MFGWPRIMKTFRFKYNFQKLAFIRLSEAKSMLMAERMIIDCHENHLYWNIMCDVKEQEIESIK